MAFVPVLEAYSKAAQVTMLCQSPDVHPVSPVSIILYVLVGMYDALSACGVS